jgi:FKBP-type peptidyl-prolyl cis-trans isomerase FkpA
MNTSSALCAALLLAAALPVTAQTDTEKLPSGMVVEHSVRGQGAQPGPTSTVQVHYRGTLPDGKEFDSSHKRGQPTTFPLNRVIPCWTEGLQRMKVGGKAKLTCPADTAYGARGVPGTIPGNSTLIFEVELLAAR